MGLVSPTTISRAGDVNTNQGTALEHRRTQAADSSSQQLVSAFEHVFVNLAGYANGYRNCQPKIAATVTRGAHGAPAQPGAAQYGGTRPAARVFRAANRRRWGPIRSTFNGTQQSATEE
jgi:hypothetical protein